ncbi:DUF4304 domain-containing protein [Pedobacter sp. FW305-3-2-15-E-R2A2]|uniref:DUF4304 domain-containing protein n=1 Tax=Pedobacter sp. FW305-3-2-15-E-R2A2 TaxID=3140251 RepID=UPI0031406196
MDRDIDLEFKSLVKNCIVPFFKSLGFKKSNLNFNRTINGVVQCANVQKSQWNHHERISFTINLGFYNETVFRISKDRINDSKFIKVDECFASVRTGHLIYDHDYWYEINLESDFPEIEERVINDLNQHLLPLFEELQTLSSLCEVLRITREDRPFNLMINRNDLAVLELEFGDFQNGRDILINQYKEAIIPKSTSHKTIYPDGREEVRWSEPRVNSFQIENLERIAQQYKIELE